MLIEGAIAVSLTEQRRNTAVGHTGAATITVVIDLARDRLTNAIITALISIAFVVAKTIGPRLTYTQGSIADFGCATVAIVTTLIDGSALVRNTLRTISTFIVITTFDVVDAHAGQPIANLSGRTLLITLTATGLNALETNTAEQRLTVVVDLTLTLKDAGVVDACLAISAIVVASTPSLALVADADLTGPTFTVTATLDLFEDTLTVPANLAHRTLVVATAAWVLNTEAELTDLSARTVIIPLTLRWWNRHAGPGKA